MICLLSIVLVLLKTESQIISNCSWGCKNCHKYLSDVCWNCIDSTHFPIINGQCGSIAEENQVLMCKTYSTDYSSCSVCESGYKVDYDNNVCVPDPSGCINYNLLGMCNICDLGTWNYNGSCVGTYMCAGYDSDNVTCVNCAYGYTLNSTDSQCYPDTSIQVGCVFPEWNTENNVCDPQACVTNNGTPVAGGCYDWDEIIENCIQTIKINESQICIRSKLAKFFNGELNQFVNPDTNRLNPTLSIYDNATYVNVDHLNEIAPCMDQSVEITYPLTEDWTAIYQACNDYLY